MPTRFAVKGRNINADNKMNFNFITSRVIFHCCSLSMEAVYLQLTLGTFFLFILQDDKQIFALGN